MNYRNIYNIVILLVSCLPAVHGFDSGSPAKSLTQYTHEVWSNDNGLPQNSVLSIAQTHDGYLWLGTQEGLVRFDGVRFALFDKSNTPELPNNYISTLFVDRSGQLWIGTYDGGLITYHDKKFYKTKGIKKFENSHIRAIFEDSRNGVWIAVRDRGVLRIDSTTHAYYDTSNGLINNEAWTFAEDARGRVWIGTENGISIYDRGTFRSFTKNDGLISDYVNDLQRGKNGSMWIATNLGIMHVPIDVKNKSAFQLYTPEMGLPDRIVYSLAFDSSGSVWAGTRKGVALISGSAIASFTRNDGLSNDEVRKVLIDRENNVWIGTDGGGLNLLRARLFSSYTTKNGLPSDIVWTMYEDNRHQMWIGTDRGLVILNQHRTKIEQYTTKNGLHDNEIYSVTVDKNGVAWIATVNGINIIERGSVKNVEPLSQTKGIISGCIITDSKNRVWAATSGNGILRFENRTLKKIYSTSNGLPSNYINSLTEDSHGNIWAGTDGDGIAVISDTGIVTIPMNDGIASPFVHAITFDKDDAAWVATFGGGLSRIKNGAMVSIGTKQGFYNDALFAILEDDFGKMWFTSNKGIFHVDKSQLNQYADGAIQRITSSVNGKEHGLKSTECNGGVQPAAWKAHDGTLWFPTTAGAATIHPSTIHANLQPPLVIFEDLLVDYRTSYMNDGAIIPPGKQRYEFHFTGINFTSPSGVVFKVKLEGYDKNWDYIGNRRTAYYTHIPPGTYTFRVMTANSDGIWSENAATFSFSRKAYLYETTEFYLLTAVFVLLFIYNAYRYRIRYIQRRQRELETLVRERTKDLQQAQDTTKQLLQETMHQKEIAQKANEMKTQLLDMVAHDLKTPLVSISVFTKELQSVTPLTDRITEDLLVIQRSTDRMLALMNDLLSVSAIESGTFRFHKEKINMIDVAGITVDGLRPLAERKDQMLFFIPGVAAECMVHADSGRIQEAIENLISNAIKYSPRRSEIVVSVEKENDIVRFWVKDNGPGISDEDKGRLFKKFQVLSAKPTANENATGLGLAIVKEIVHAHDGTVYVESELGKGSKFVIELKAV